MSPARPRVLVALRPNGIEPPGLRRSVEGLVDLVLVTGVDGVPADAGDIEIAFVWNFRSTVVPDAIGRLTDLRWVHVAAVGVDASLSAEVRRRQLTVTNSRGVTAVAMAEYALTLMLAHAKDLPTTLADQADRRWRPRETRLLAGTTLVTVGVGAVNRELACRAKSMGMRVIGVGRTARHINGFDQVVGADQLERAMAEAAYVVVATPLTEETRGMVGATELAALPDGAVIVNIGRGPVIEEAALVQEIDSGRLGGVGLDVVWREPLEPDHPLWQHDRVLLSPHMSADFVGWETAMVDLFVTNLRRYLTGQSVLNVVDLDLGYAPLN
ncbi:D-2-hydroxyacid dehydrogenase [Nakamurella lactea]|uniref:D-2-hydroxyacid dehydrogenase n=1 Tax=Nakamurella lactea TaxID=459515 RepID=UPI00056B72E2|nr:D-2-hydroxyacid dehydrogenase [Nakamurella lactea]